jgi:cell division protease FtsH
MKRLRLWFRRIRQMIRNHPAQALGVAAILAIQLVSGISVWSSYAENRDAVARLEALPEKTLNDLQEDAKAGKVDTILAHSVKAGTFLKPDPQAFIEARKGDTPLYVVEEPGVLSEEAWKTLVQVGSERPIKFEAGFKSFLEGRLDSFLMMTMLFLMLVLALVFAQSMIGELTSGHSFKPQRTNLELTMADVIGYEQVKEQFTETLQQLDLADHYKDAGVLPPRGILLTGDPGVGKTMMAQALANAWGAEFFFCTGSDFVEMYVGVGARRVRSLFKRARQASRALIFIDEIDAIGSRQDRGSDSERMSTINQMLSELDGINQNGKILVLGATNHAERLDAAMRRPGRFDKIIHIPLPDRVTRRGILTKYMEGANIVPDEGRTLEEQMDAWALRTQGYSGAQLKSVANESKNLALRQNPTAPVVTNRLFLLAQEQAILGVMGKKAQGEELTRVTYHELGHALAMHVFCKNAYVEKVCIEGRGGALGYTLSRPVEERLLQTYDELKGELRGLLGGRAAELVFLNTTSSGASDDLRRANDMAERMVCHWGMGEHTGIMLPQDEPGQEWPEHVQTDIRQLLDDADRDARACMEQHRVWMMDTFQKLLARGVLVHDEIVEGLAKESLHTHEQEPLSSV